MVVFWLSRFRNWSRAVPRPRTGRGSLSPQPPEAPRLLSRNSVTAAFAFVSISAYLLCRYLWRSDGRCETALLVCLVFAGAPVVADLLRRILHREFGSDLLAGVSIVASASMHDYLPGMIVVLMLSGGATLEE